VRSIYSIDQHLEAVLNATVDPETGEISEEGMAALYVLEGEKHDVYLAAAAYVKGQRAEAGAVRAVAAAQVARAEKHERHADRLERWLQMNVPEGEKLSDARSQIVWRKSTGVDVTDPEALPELFWRVKVRTERTPDRPMIAEALKAGDEVPGARLEHRNTLSIK